MVLLNRDEARAEGDILRKASPVNDAKEDGYDPWTMDGPEPGLVLGGLGTMAYLWATGTFDRNAAVVSEQASDVHDTRMAEALSGSSRKPRPSLPACKDYRCVYLREEVIQGKLLSNHTVLRLAPHAPFSVGMEWLGPSSKKGRKTVWVAGKNNNKMLVKQLIVKMEMDPQESIRRKESRHTIDEAGLKNLIDRYDMAWEREQQLGLTTIAVQDTLLTVKLPGKEHHLDCICVTATHPPDSHKQFKFHVTKLYFDKKTGLPVRSENYEFPRTWANAWAGRGAIHLPGRATQRRPRGRPFHVELARWFSLSGADAPRSDPGPTRIRHCTLLSPLRFQADLVIPERTSASIHEANGHRRSRPSH